MTTSCLALTAAVMVMGLSVPAAGGLQDQIPLIPTLQPGAATSMTVTGCVGRGSTADTYVLTNATRNGEAAVKNAGTTETLQLSGADVDISTHVGHQVSVTGKHRAMWTTGATDIKPGTDSPMPKLAATVPGAFTVTSLKMIAATCSEAGD